jgi:hypothetical protein
MDIQSTCPYCGEFVDLWIDEDGGTRQHYVEDCPVCCRPCQVEVIDDGDGEVSVELSRLDA